MTAGGSQNEGASRGGWQRVQLPLVGPRRRQRDTQSTVALPCLLWLSLSLDLQPPILFSVHDFVLLSSCRRSYLAAQTVRVEIAPYRSRPFVLSCVQLLVAAASTVCASRICDARRAPFLDRCPACILLLLLRPSPALPGKLPRHVGRPGYDRHTTRLIHDDPITPLHTTTRAPKPQAALSPSVRKSPNHLCVSSGSSK